MASHNCDICQKSLRSLPSLQSHQEDCPPGRGPSCYCEVCGKKLKTKATLKAHIKTLHQVRPSVECNVCGKVFGSERNLRLHRRSVHVYTEVSCPLCVFTTKTPTLLQKHIGNQHKPSDEIFSCDLCPFESKTQSNLNAHKRGLHRLQWFVKYFVFCYIFVSYHFDQNKLHIF